MIPTDFAGWAIYAGLICLGYVARHRGIGIKDQPPPPPFQTFLDSHPLAGQFYRFLADRLSQTPTIPPKQ